MENVVMFAQIRTAASDLCGSGVDLGRSGVDLGGSGGDLSGSGVYLPVGNRIQPRRSSFGRRGSRTVRHYPIGAAVCICRTDQGGSGWI